MTTKLEVRAELGHRSYTEEFAKKEEAAAFVQAVLRNEALRWNSSAEVTAKGGVLIVRAKGLEDLVEMKAGTLSDEVSRGVKAFLGGHWPPKDAKKGQVSTDEVNGHPAKAVVAKVGLITLAEMCAKNKWTPRIMRAHLRSAKMKKPSSGWAWPSAEAVRVEKKLKELLT